MSTPEFSLLVNRIVASFVGEWTVTDEGSEWYNYMSVKSTDGKCAEFTAKDDRMTIESIFNLDQQRYLNGFSRGVYRRSLTISVNVNREFNALMRDINKRLIQPYSEAFEQYRLDVAQDDAQFLEESRKQASLFEALGLSTETPVSGRSNRYVTAGDVRFVIQYDGIGNVRVGDMYLTPEQTIAVFEVLTKGQN